MMKLADYAEAFRHAKLDRDDAGILTVTLHSKHGPLAWGARPHEEMGHLFHAIGADRGNRVVILTGAGDAFCDRVFDAPAPSTHGAAMTAEAWEHVQADGRRMLTALLDIPVPVIAAVNGRATIHAELAVLSDIVLAADTATFADAPHFPYGLVPGDGVHVIWPELLGPNRGRHFLLTGQVIDAAEALRLGVVAEVLPPADLLPRAQALATQLAGKPDLVLRHTRALLTQRWKKLLLGELGHGLALEGLGAIAHWPPGG